jgi:hypothetical protein
VYTVEERPPMKRKAKPKKRKLKVDATHNRTVRVRVDAYGVVCEAVENGIAYGWRRAHKHADAPGEEAICSAIYQAVINELCEALEFPPFEEEANATPR